MGLPSNVVQFSFMCWSALFARRLTVLDLLSLAEMEASFADVKATAGVPIRLIDWTAAMSTASSLSSSACPTAAITLAFVARRESPDSCNTAILVFLSIGEPSM